MGMRVDKFLKTAKILKRRAVANQACDGQKVLVNGKIVKPAYNVKVGDVIEIAFASGTLKLKVLIVPEKQPKNTDELYVVMP